MKKSTNNKIHWIKENYYVCNRAIGKHKEGVVNLPIDFITCKNCRKKMVKEEWK